MSEKLRRQLLEESHCFSHGPVTDFSDAMSSTHLKVLARRLIAPTHKQADLTLPGVALELFKKHKPSHVVHLAARVGGIGYNQVAPAPLYLDNLLMGTHTIEAARIAGVEKTVLLGTVCSYPKFTPVPFREESIWTATRRKQMPVRHRQKSTVGSMLK